MSVTSAGMRIDGLTGSSEWSYYPGRFFFFCSIFASLVSFVLRHSLKYLNVSANALGRIPPSSESEESLSTLQELYLTGNNLTENCGALLVGHQNLRVLHIAYNQLFSFPARCVFSSLTCVRATGHFRCCKCYAG